MYRRKVVVRIQPGDCSLELTSKNLQEEVGAMRPRSVSVLCKVPLSNLVDHRADLFQSKHFCSRLLGAVDLSGKSELQPNPIFHALIDSVQIAFAQATAPNDLVAGHAIWVQAVLRGDAGTLSVLSGDPRLQLLRKPSVITLCVVGNVRRKVPIHALDRTLVLGHVCSCLSHQASTEEVEQEHPDKVFAEGLQLDIVGTKLLACRLESNVSSDLVGHCGDTAQVCLARVLNNRLLDASKELLLQERPRSVQDPLAQVEASLGIGCVIEVVMSKLSFLDDASLGKALHPLSLSHNLRKSFEAVDVV